MASRPDHGAPGAPDRWIGDQDQLLLLLLQLASPALPIGAAGHSLGLETAVSTGALRTAADLLGRLRAYLAWQAGPSEGAAVALAWDAARSHDLDKLTALDQTLDALRVSREGREAGRQMGRAFLRAVPALSPTGPLVAALAERVASGRQPGQLAVAIGTCGAENHIPRAVVVTASLFSALSQLIAVATRIMPLGQFAAQQVLASLRPDIVAAARQAGQAREIEDLRTFGPAWDIDAMRHERLYSRLCIS